MLEDLTALWDTGATDSAISQGVVSRLGLTPIGTRMVRGVLGVEPRPVFLVDVHLPNGIVALQITASLAELEDFDVLVGMDIIRLGDLAVSNAGGRTTFTFRIPPQASIDFVEDAKRSSIWSAFRRNALVVVLALLAGGLIGAIAGLMWP